MATQYPSYRSSRPSGNSSRFASETQPGISRSRSGSSYGSRPSSGQRSGYSASRPASQRTSSGARPASSGQRGYSQRPSGARVDARRTYSGGSGRGPSYNNGRRPQRRKPQGRFFAFLAVALVLVVGLILLLSRPGKQPDPAVNNVQTAMTNTAVPASAEPSGIDVTSPDEPETQTQFSNIAEMLSDTDNQVEGLSEDQMVQVEDLSINQSLPTEWMNILLLGTDERRLSNSARTDAMLICSINQNTGEVKLTSIMRDLAVTFDDIGKYNGTYDINAANYFGGAKLAVKTVNKLFDMNIQYCVMVNFFGFQKIAQRLGGVEMDITEAEMNIINKDIVQQAKMAYRAGIDESDQENTYLESYGPNTHLNGRQTLAYARIRHLDGGDYMRTSRQQAVLSKLMEKVKKMNALEITTLGAEMIGNVKTNMELDDIIRIAILVAGNGIPNLETFRLPVQGTYKEERRNNNSLLWDCDFATNAVKLYDFIYE